MKMITTYLFTLLQVRFRKMQLKDIAMPYFFGISVCVLIAIIWQEKGTYDGLIFLLLAEQIKYHLNRSDLSFLKNKTNYFYTLVLSEYLVLSVVPLTVLLLIKAYLFLGIYSLVIFILPIVPQLKSNYLFNYPFANHFPEWKIYFRKKYLAILLTIPYLLLIPTVLYVNFNIGLFGFVLMALICCSVYFDREPLFFLRKVNCNSKIYLKTQIQNAIKNVLLLVIPFASILLFYFTSEWMLILFACVTTLLIIMVAIITKYAYHTSQLTQGLVLSLIAGGMVQPMYMIVGVVMVFISYKKCRLFLKQTIDE